MTMQGGLDEAKLAQAADAIRDVDGLLIGAGAGMGVDSGSPDFRGNRGFWRAYPPMARLGLPLSALLKCYKPSSNVCLVTERIARCRGAAAAAFGAVSMEGS